MNAKEYLSRVMLENKKLNNRMKQLDELKDRALSLGGFDFSEDRVVTSSAGDTMAERVTRYVELENRINDEWDGYIKLRNKVTLEINALTNSNYVELLGLRYLRGLKLTECAKQMGYTYDHIKHMHGAALQEFTKRHNLNTQKHQRV